MYEIIERPIAPAPSPSIRGRATDSPPWWKRRIGGFILLSAIPLACAGLLSFLLAKDSFDLTNPPNYHYAPGTGELARDGSGTDPRTDFGLDYQDVSFPAVDGSTLRGWLVRAASARPSVGIVAVHGRAMDRRAFLPHLPMLHELGANVLLFDMRENGLSDGAQRGMSMGYRETADVESAVHYLKSTGVSHVVVIGMSLGAGTAILAGAEDPQIDGVIAESPFSSMQEYVQYLAQASPVRARLAAPLPPQFSWGNLVVGFTAWRVGVQHLEAPIDVIQRISPRPVLLIHGTADSQFTPDHSERLYARASQPKALWLAPGAEHTQVFEAYPDEYRARVAGLIAQVVQ